MAYSSPTCLLEATALQTAACITLFLGALAPCHASSPTVNVAEERLLGPPRAYAVTVYPLELLTYATINAPQLSFELWIDLDGGFALNIQPRAIWYPPTEARSTHDGGIGGAIGFYWFSRRSLTGPFYGVYGGDVEAFLSSGHGRIYGATATFGYAIGYENGGILSFSFGVGYWHREGTLDTGVQWPEILSLRIGTGYGWGTGGWDNP